MVSTSNTDGKEEFQRKKTPGPFKGVRMRKWGRWVSEIRVPKSQSRIWLGSYDAPEKAARAYDAALYCLRGIRGEFNFPAEKRPELPNGPPTTLSKMDIKAIAERFAKSISVSVPMSSPATPPPPPPPPMTMTTSPDVPVSTTETEMMGNYNIFDVALDPGNLVPPLDDSLWLWDDQIIIEPEFSLDLFKGF